MKTHDRPTPQARHGLLLIAALACVASGCQTAAKQDQPLAFPVKDLTPLNHTACLDGRAFHPLTAEALIARASRADIVLIGEVHKNAQGLAAANALWQAIVEAKPGAVLALEFIERDQQIELDDWLGMETPIKPDGFSFAHGPMLLTAKQNKRPVIAANAPRRYVRLARTKGYAHLEAMTPVQRATFVFPEPQPTGGYRDRFFKMFSGESHGQKMTPERIEGFWRAQTMWDATMADSVVGALTPKQRPIVLVVGRFHVEQDGGIPQLIRARRPDAKVFSIVMATQAQVDKARQEPDHLPIADAVWVLEEET